MNRQFLYDRAGRRIGEILTRDDGSRVAYTVAGMRVGEYQPKSNTTVMANGTRGGSGSLLTLLLGEKR